MQARIHDYRLFLQGHLDTPLADLARAANISRPSAPHRLFIVAKEPQQAERLLASGEYPIHVLDRAAKPPCITFLFTGQGAQYTGMGRELYDAHPFFRRTFAQCAELADPTLERPLRELLFDSNCADLLHQTGCTQPLLFAFEYALALLWKSWGVSPSFVMGHSLGEYVAATAAGILSLEEGMNLVLTRARLMQALPAGGAMAAIRLDRASVEECLLAYNALHPNAIVEIAAINGPSQVVISGDKRALEQFTEPLIAQEIEVTPLSVSHAFHSALMQPMLKEFGRLCAKVAHREPQIPVISNVTGHILGKENINADYWLQHIRKPVDFYAGMRTLSSLGSDCFLEIGPQPVLLGMGRQCFSEEQTSQMLWLPSMRREIEVWPLILRGLGNLYLKGIEINWDAFYKPDECLAD